MSYKKHGSRGISSAAYWVCEIREDKIVFWESFSDRQRALAASGL